MTFKSKSLRALIGIGFVLSMTFMSACGPDSECPPVEQPDIQELTSIQQQRFPYRNLNSLTFRIEKKGKVDTVTLLREKFDSTILTTGDDFYHENDCVKPYESRWRILYANYHGEDGKGRLKFTMNKSGSRIYMQWNTDSISVGKGFITELIGRRNDSFATDTAYVLGRAVTPAVCWIGGQSWRSDSIDVCYSFYEGFIKVHDRENKLKWELISAFE